MKFAAGISLVPVLIQAVFMVTVLAYPVPQYPGYEYYSPYAEDPYSYAGIPQSSPSYSLNGAIPTYPVFQGPQVASSPYYDLVGNGMAGNPNFLNYPTYGMASNSVVNTIPAKLDNPSVTLGAAYNPATGGVHPGIPITREVMNPALKQTGNTVTHVKTVTTVPAANGGVHHIIHHTSFHKIQPSVKSYFSVHNMLVLFDRLLQAQESLPLPKVSQGHIQSQVVVV